MIKMDSRETQTNDYAKAAKVISVGKTVGAAAAAVLTVGGVVVKTLPKIKGLLKK